VTSDSWPLSFVHARRLHSGAPRESRGKIAKAPIMTQGAERAPRELQDSKRTSPRPEGNGSAPNNHNNNNNSHNQQVRGMPTNRAKHRQKPAEHRNREAPSAALAQCLPAVVADKVPGVRAVCSPLRLCHR